MDAGRLFGRGIAFPPRIGPEGRLAWSEGEQNVRESIQIILLSELNERLRSPEFGAGLNSFLFEPNTIATHTRLQDRIEKALARFEPRIRVQSVDVQPDPQDAQSAIATLSYRLVATGAAERVSLSVKLGG